MKKQDNYFVKNPHGVVIVVGESELEHIKNQVGFEIMEKVPAEETQGISPELPDKNLTKDVLECSVCGTKGVGRNKFKTSEDVEKHISKKHPN